MDARCYICLEDEGDDVLYDVCACKRRHGGWLLIEQTKRVDCTICTQPLPACASIANRREHFPLLEVLLMFVLFAFFGARRGICPLSSFDNCVICAILALWCFLYQCALAKIVFSTSYSGVEQTTICTDGLRDMSLRV